MSTTSFSISSSTIETSTEHSDLDLAERVRLFLATRQVGELRQLAVTAQQGRVRLTGRLSSYYHRQLALATARRVAGVLSIDDRLSVGKPPRPAPAPKASWEETIIVAV